MLWLGISVIAMRNSALAALTILILLPSITLYQADAQGLIAGHQTDASPLKAAKIVSSGVLLPVSRVELRSLPASSEHSPRQTLRHILSSGTGTLRDSSGVAAPAVLGIQSSSSVALLSGFDGLNQIQSCPCVPPDVQVAAGADRIVEMVNLEGEVFTKQGISNKTFSLSTFFKTGTDSISDPKVLFDAPSGRWFTSLVDITTNNVMLGVSSTGDPTGIWVLYALAAGGNLPDQPIIGISDDKVALAANDFHDTTFVGSQFWILNKNQLLIGSSVNFFTSGANSGVFSVHPAQSLNSTTTQYMVSNIVSRRGLSTTSVRLFAIAGVPGVTTVTAVTTDLAVSNIGTLSGGGLPGGIQPGTSVTVDTVDFRVQDAVWYKGAVWVAFDDACTPTGDTQLRSCIRLTKITTITPPVVSQDFDFGTHHQYNFYPVLRVDKKGNLLVLFGFSNSTTFPSLGVTGQLTTDPAGTLAFPRTLKAGTAADTSTRYGDYFGAALDPADPTVAWVAGEYHDNSTGSCQTFGSCWSTFIGSISTVGFTVSATPNSIRLSSVSSRTSNVTFTSLNGFTGPVSITATSPTGVTASPATALRNLTSGGNASIILTFSVGGSLAPGNYAVTVTGTNGPLSRTTNLSLTVFPDFNISSSCPCGITVLPGSQFRENLTLNGLNAFSGVVGLVGSVFPAVNGGPIVSPAQSNQLLTPGSSTVASLVITGGNSGGIFTITVTATCLSGTCTSSAQQHSISLLVMASAASFGGGGHRFLV
jgi:hypothetical protein